MEMTQARRANALNCMGAFHLLGPIALRIPAIMIVGKPHYRPSFGI
jgi:hypothetical protein